MDAGAEAVAQGQPAIEHGLYPYGGVRAALGLRAGRLASSLLRALAQRTQVAAPKPYEMFAELIDRHWDGCLPENKVALGFVEGVNNKYES